MTDSANALRERTMNLSLSIVALFRSLPRRSEAQLIGRQLLRSATSVGAQYREACRARSKAEFISKMESSLQELDETLYWLELLLRSKIMDGKTIGPIHGEADQIAAMMVASIRRTKANDQA